MLGPIHFSVFLMGLLVGVCNTAQENIMRVGNDIEPRSSSLDIAGVTILLNDFAPADGVVFAFSGFFVNDNPVHFQIWRPIGEEKYKLLHEWPYQATAGGQRENLYIHTRPEFQCMTMETGDRLGIYMGVKPGAIGYAFDFNNAHVLGHTESNLTSTGDVVEFETLLMPYEFSAAVYLDGDVSAYNNRSSPSCPTNLLIPDDESSSETEGPSQPLRQR